MQQAIPYSSGRSAWFPAAGRSPALLDRSSFERSPLSGSSTRTTTTSSSGAGSVTSGGGSGSPAAATSVGGIRSLVSENPVLVLSRRGCCMCHVVRRLLLGLGVNPTVCEVDEDREETVVIEELTGAAADGRQAAQLPAVFIGGKYVGGLDRLMAAHISGELVPILKEAGALWL
ncbi:hypothetical protein Taro_003742 [Colocasia esculenta]|uniref:Glutaredoxin domain-containing protein n=1 Tax=Colocasia esculenta TaxID=4460 RepID=A0A843TKJ6_COLES|nr:hypothetical protein [Colocasia esculenta]